MHPFGGTPKCPKCTKSVYAAEQVRRIRPLFPAACSRHLRLDYGSWTQGTILVSLSLPVPLSFLFSYIIRRVRHYPRTHSLRLIFQISPASGAPRVTNVSTPLAWLSMTNRCAYISPPTNPCLMPISLFYSSSFPALLVSPVRLPAPSRFPLTSSQQDLSRQALWHPRPPPRQPASSR